MSSACWRLDGSLARLACDGLSGQIDLTQPSHGLHGLVLNGVGLADASLLGPVVAPESEAATALAEAYVRGRDLVATYEQTDNRPCRIQVYWSLLEAAPEQGHAIDMRVSVQTNLLDAASTIQTRSHVRCREAWGANQAANAFQPIKLSPDGLFRRAAYAPACWWLAADDPGVGYAEMVHPADAQHDALHKTPGGACTLTHELFERDLEKGVLLRARLRGVLLDGRQSLDVVLDWYRRLLQAPLPLTT